MFNNIERDDNYTYVRSLSISSYLETLLTYGRDDSTSHFTNSFWYLDSGDLQAYDPTPTADPANMGFVARWNRIKQRKELQLIVRLHLQRRSVSPPRRQPSDKTHQGEKVFIPDEYKGQFHYYI